MNSFLTLVTIIVVVFTCTITTSHARGIENRDMSICERKSNGLCKCDTKDVFGASCNSCRTDDACGASSKCLRTGIVQEDKVTGWCKVQDTVSEKYLNGKPHIELSLTSQTDTQTGKFDLYRQNENNKFQSVLSCDISDCSQVKDHKNNRVFTKCGNVDTCRATCTAGKGKDHWCNKVTEHFNELERSGFTFDSNEKDNNGRMKFMCKDDGKHCSLQESYGLMPEFASLNKVECAFSECVNRDDTLNLRA